MTPENEVIISVLVRAHESQRERADAAESLLNRVEWSTNRMDGKGDRCPLCDAAKPPGGPGHEKDCLFWSHK